MTILTIRTDKPEAEIDVYNGKEHASHLSWEAHRQLAETLHQKIREILESKEMDLKDVNGIVVYKGPGSFTGLRIGLSVANVLADTLDIPIVATSGEDWQKNGIELLLDGKNQGVALPEYGSEPKTTVQKK